MIYGNNENPFYKMMESNKKKVIPILCQQGLETIQFEDSVENPKTVVTLV